MKSLLICTALASALIGGAAQAAEPLYFALLGNPNTPDWCVYRSEKERDAAVERDGYDNGQVIREEGLTRVDIGTYTPSGDWSIVDNYRFTAEGGALKRSGASATTKTSLKAEYSWAAGQVPTRTKLEIRELKKPFKPSENFYPKDFEVVTIPESFNFWGLVQQMDADPSESKLCAKATGFLRRELP